jgi:hypothetical protein
MALIDRVKNILLTPKTEWPTISGEAATTQSIYVEYVLILAAIGPIALMLRGGMIGATVAIASYVIGLAVIFVAALIVDALAPSFGGEKNFVQSLKLVAYSCTAAWVGGIFNLLPFIGGILGLVAGIYTIYTFYLGAPVLKKCTPEKAVVFTIVIVICGFVIGAVLASILFGSGMGVMGGMSGSAMFR